MSTQKYVIGKRQREFIKWMMEAGNASFVVSSWYWDVCTRVLQDGTYHGSDINDLNHLHQEYSKKYISSKPKWDRYI